MLDNRSEKIFIETFKVLDFDGDGLIREEELEKALKYMNKSLTRDEIKDIMDYACTDQDGITLDAFLKLMLRRF
jgi:Ca2+-binding EF-hand superfamily protein